MHYWEAAGAGHHPLRRPAAPLPVVFPDDAVPPRLDQGSVTTKYGGAATPWTTPTRPRCGGCWTDRRFRIASTVIRAASTGWTANCCCRPTTPTPSTTTA